jgi:hypothetical protein
MYNGVLFSHEKNDILWFTTKWTELEDVMLSETIQTLIDKYFTFSLTCIFFHSFSFCECPWPLL